MHPIWLVPGKVFYSTIVVRCLDRVLPIKTFKMAELARFDSYLVENLEDRFSRVIAYIICTLTKYGKTI